MPSDSLWPDAARFRPDTEISVRGRVLTGQTVAVQEYPTGIEGMRFRYEVRTMIGGRWLSMGQFWENELETPDDLAARLLIQ